MFGKAQFNFADVEVDLSLTYHLERVKQPHHFSIHHVSTSINSFDRVSDEVGRNKVQQPMGQLMKLGEYTVT